MAAVIKIDFRIGGDDGIARAIASTTKAAQRAAQEQAKVVKQAAKESADGQKAAAKEAAAFQAQLDKASANAFKARVREQVGAEKAAMRERASTQKAFDKAAEQDFKRSVRERDQAVKVAEKQAASRQNSVRSGVGEIGGGAARGLKRGISMVAGAAALATGGLGLGTVAKAAQSQLDLDSRAALLRNSSGKSADEKKGGFDAVRRAKSVSNATGTDAGEIMGGFEQISAKAGGAGIDAIKDNFLELAKVAKGAGVNMTDLGDVVGTLVNRGVKAETLVGVVESLVQQGKDGAVEFKDLATMLDASSGALGKFKMGENDRVTTAGGLSQLARTYGKSSAAEATNSVVDLSRDIGGKADIVQQLTGGTATTTSSKGTKVKKLVDGKMVTVTEGAGSKTTMAGGVEVGTDSTRAQLRSINDLLPEIISGAFKKGNAGKIMGEGGIFTGNSTAIVGPLIQAFSQGLTKDKSGRLGLTKDGETADIKGEDAVRALMKQASAADVPDGSSAKAFDEVMSTSSAKFSVAMAQVTNQLGDQLAPKIAELAPKIAKLAEVFGGAVGAMIDSPKAAVAVFLGLSTAMGAAEGAVGFFGKRLLDNLFDKKAVATMQVTAGNVVMSGGASGVPGAASGAPSLATKAFAVGAAGAAGFELGSLVAQGGNSDIDKRDASVRGDALTGSNLASKIRMGHATAAERAQAATMADKLEGETGASGAFQRFIGGATAGIKGLAGGDVSAGNIASVLPPLAAARGIYGAAVGGSEGKAAGDSAKELRDALAGGTKITGGQVEVSNLDGLTDAMSRMADAIGQSNLQGPKASPP